MKVLRELDVHRLRSLQEDGYRITVKIIFRNRNGKLLLCTSGPKKNRYDKKANIPGGGINLRQEGIVQGTFREVNEEMRHAVPDLKERIRNASILAEGWVPTKRKGYDYKYLVIILVDVRDFVGMRPRNLELANFTVLPNAKHARRWLDTKTETITEVLALMKRAVAEISDMKKVAGQRKKK